MKKSTIIILGILAALLLMVFSAVGWYIRTSNSFVALDEGVKSSWSQVENQYQRRMDLVPNLVEVVKGIAQHETDVFKGVAEARSSVGKLQVSADVLNDPAMFKKYQDAQGQLSGALSRLLAVAENYPQLKSAENFLALQSQLEGTENRIAVERRRFNEVVQEYNTRIRMFPGSFVAGMNGLTQKPYFESQPGADKAPQVKF